MTSKTEENGKKNDQIFASWFQYPIRVRYVRADKVAVSELNGENIFVKSLKPRIETLISLFIRVSREDTNGTFNFS